MSEKRFHVDIVTPDRIVFSGGVNRFFASSVEGYFEILYNHTPFLAALKTGKLIVTQEEGKKYFAVCGGFVEVFNNDVIVLAETAEYSKDIDTERAKKSKERALTRIIDKSSSVDIERAKVSLVRALTRLSVTKVW